MHVRLGLILLVDSYNTGRDTRLINGCGPTPESVRGSKGRNAQRRGFLSEDSCRSSERVSATIGYSYLHSDKNILIQSKFSRYENDFIDL